MNINLINFLNNLEKNNELFSFIESIFEIKPKVVQYKIINNNLNIKIFTNQSKNLFLSYVFLNSYNDKYNMKIINNDCIINYIYIDKCYELVNNNNYNNLILFASSLKR